MQQLSTSVYQKKELPEKVLQFGTGSFLRGFTDAFINNANRNGAFNGSVVVISSMDSPRVDTLNAQDGLYTLRLEGMKGDDTIEDNQVISCLSRVLSAQTQWDEILKCAVNPDMQYVVSNTTEAGLVLEKEDISATPPESFPAKLTAFLLKRYEWLKEQSDQDRSMVILPCELITNNGNKLKEYVLSQAEFNKLPNDFVEWINQEVTFCNTLVDRIVTGKPSKEKLGQLQDQLGYVDEMLDVAEPYGFWAIEGSSGLSEKIDFAKANEEILFADDITPYRERKIRILNGLHIMMVPVGLLAGIKTVEEAITDEQIGPFLIESMKKEIIPSVDMPEDELLKFAGEVISRFKNPFLDHQLTAIALNATSKFKVRVLSTLTDYFETNQTLPENMVFALSSMLVMYNGRFDHFVNDDDSVVTFFKEAWSAENIEKIVDIILSNPDIWGQDLTKIPELSSQVITMVQAISENGIRSAINK